MVIYSYITKTRSVSWAFSSDCKVPLSGSLVCPQDTEQGNEDALELLMARSQCYACRGCGVGVGWAGGKDAVLFGKCL